jgi:RimJ/RimL family protein N-acetyltransferase
MNVSVRRLVPSDAQALAELFAGIATDPAAALFHPHPFTMEKAHEIANWSRQDIYLGLFMNGALQGYGMLRGWDEGYDVPSLGIYLGPGTRGVGLARVFMQELHDWARKAGARRVRLKVYPDNTRALAVYRAMGYCFGDAVAGQLVGLVELEPR